MYTIETLEAMTLLKNSYRSTIYTKVLATSIKIALEGND